MANYATYPEVYRRPTSSFADVIGNGKAALFTLAVSAASMLVLIFAYADQVNPFATPASLYVYAGAKAATLFTGAVFALAFAGAAVTTGIRRLGVRLAGMPTVLMSAWITSVVLVALFPTDPGAGVTSTSGWIHRVAAVGVLGILPIAGLFLARRIRPESARAATAVRWLSAVGCALMLGCLASRLPDMAPGWSVAQFLQQYPVDGLLQRMLFGVEIAVLAIPAGMVALARRS
ncbi:MAG: DUF998 domain-containing protein [Hamadaea sp.]|uniref:DUF998 domain-containing protein n=1 Tax=Hamadaea sp. TaxID=2024425 RepID=UPI0017A066A6|nr:DUF998 domain-containing protein [Hamadaea sp.]NUR71961.1 DUF998 domain-containing protein [Hamadaea sp.]NUT17804.1 DUF998 domain-containing protein [Hamadaea sp.]